MLFLLEVFPEENTSLQYLKSCMEMCLSKCKENINCLIDYRNYSLSYPKVSMRKLLFLSNYSSLLINENSSWLKPQFQDNAQNTFGVYYPKFHHICLFNV